MLSHAMYGISRSQTVASFTKEVNPRLAKGPLVFNGRLTNRWLTSLDKEATVRVCVSHGWLVFETNRSLSSMEK